jgi:hypothetical protein
VKRDAVIYRTSADGRICVALDLEFAPELLAYIKRDKRHEKKFDHIVELILNQHKNRELYDKEAINDRCKDVAAMKFFKGQENDRVYCKQGSLPDETGKPIFVVIAARLHLKKKTETNSQAEINLIETVATYEYDYTTFSTL